MDVGAALTAVAGVAGTLGGALLQALDAAKDAHRDRWSEALVIAWVWTLIAAMREAIRRDLGVAGGRCAAVLVPGRRRRAAGLRRSE